MAKKEIAPNETIVTLKTNAIGNAFLSQNGAAANRIKDTYDLKFSHFKTKLRLISNDTSPDADLKRTKASDIVKQVIELQENGQIISPKHLDALITGDPVPTEFKQIIKDNGQSVQKPIYPHPREIQVDLHSGEAINTLFNGDRTHIKMIESIFDTRITPEKNTTVSIKPTGKPSRKPSEVIQEKLLVEQAQNVLTSVAKAVAGYELLSERMIGLFVLTAVKGAPNEEKTKGRILRSLGAIHFPEFMSENQQDQNEQSSDKASAEKKSKNIHVSGDFGDNFVKSREIEGLFKRKMQMEMSYYGKDGKRLTLTKKKDCTVDFEKAEMVVMYAQEKYNDTQGTINPALIENAVDNVLAGRDVGFIDQNKRSDLVTSSRREQYKLSTFNRSGENINMYPKTESQYEISDILRGKPSKDQKSAYNNQGSKITYLIGPAASGKTAWGIFTSADAFKNGWIENLYLTRPDVGSDGKPAKLVPGDMKMKSAGTMAPLYENLLKVMPEAETSKWIKEPLPPGAIQPIVKGKDPSDHRKIEINEVGLMRGRTVEKGVLLVDEAQNCTDTEIRMLQTRIGKDGRIILSFDLDQIDLPNKRQSGALSAIIAAYEAHEAGLAKAVNMVAVNGNLRAAEVDQVLDMYHMFDTNGKETTREKRLYTVDNQYEKALFIRYGTSDRDKVKAIRENERKFGLEKTGAAPYRDNIRSSEELQGLKESLLIDFQSAKEKIQTNKQNEEMQKAIQEGISAGLTAGFAKLAEMGVLKVG